MPQSLRHQVFGFPIGALVAVLLCLMGHAPCHGAMSLLFREMFATTGSLTPESPGAFSSLTGEFFQRAGGPRLSGGSAASVDLQGTASSAHYGFEGLGHTKIFVGGWFFIKSMASAGTVLLSVADPLGNPGPVISDVGGKLGAGVLYGGWTACPIDPVNRWVYFGIGISQINSTTADVRFYYKLPGGPMNHWAEITTGNAGIASPGQLLVGTMGNNPAVEYRMGAPSVYTFEEANFSDVVYPADLIEPERGLTWYCNPATGNDADDGTTPETAWASVAKINSESLHTGMFTAGSHAEGDTLVIDTSGSDLELADTALAFRTAGLNVRAAAGEIWVRLKSFKTLSAGNWSATAMPHVFASADTELHSVVWEDDKFMHHPTGADFAAVANSLEATPGSFWTDGTTLYLHPFGGTDPRVDGKRYERSYNFAEGMAVALHAPNLHVRDIFAGKTCLAHKLNNDAIGNYCMGTRDRPGATLIEHCYLYYGAKHNLGLVLGGAGDSVIVDGVQAEQGSPYPWAGGQSVFVSFSSGPSGLGITHIYRNCVTRANTGLIGSSTGTMTRFYPVFYCHNVSGENQFAVIEFDGCDFGPGNLQGSAAQEVNLTDTSCGEVGFDSNVTLSRCLIEGSTLNSANRTLTARNCIYIYRDMLTRNMFSGSVDIRACTFDASGVTSIQGGVPDAALFSRAGPLSLTFQNNAVIMPAAAVMGNVFSNLRSTDTLDFSHNGYQLNGSVLSYRYDDVGTIANRSFGQWQAMGFDADSLEAADLQLSALIPQWGSPLVGAGHNLGPLEDYGGRKFQVRDDIGAYEMAETFQHWQAEKFSTEELQDPEVSGPQAAAGMDGIANLVKYALHLAPDANASEELPKAGVTPEGDYVTLTYTRLHDAFDLTYVVEQSLDLRSWFAADVETEEILASDANTETVRACVPVGSEGRMFLRLGIILNPD